PIYAIIQKGGMRFRIAVGKELSSPVGQWKVTIARDDVYFYWFSKDGTVKWDDGKLIGGDSGKGTWATVGGQLQLSWASGGRETWDLPLFTEEQPGALRRKDGAVHLLEAEKIIDSNRTID